MTPAPPVPYLVAYSADVQEQIRSFWRRARDRGLAAAFADAVRELDRRLRIHPQFGDPLQDLTHQKGQTWIGTVPPLVVRYAILDDRRVVLVSLPVSLLPHSGL